jgi:transposase-like protein
MAYYASDCSKLTELVLPAVGWFENHKVDWSVPSGRLGKLKGRVLNLDDLNDWKALTVSGKTLYTNYIRNPELVYYEEYCEYAADLIRTIIQSQSYNADTKRSIAQEAEYQADMVRQIAIGQEFKADTLRQIVIQQEFTADAIRQVIQSQGYNADAKRQVLKTYEHNADTLRKVLAEQSFSGDTKRHIVQDALLNADTVRKIVKEYEFIADTLRHVIMPYKQLIITMSIQEREVKLGVEQMPLIGNTVRLKAEFKDFNGKHVSPENVNLRIYDGYKKQVGEDIPVFPSDVGKYQYDYVIPGDVIGPLYFEFVGTIGGLPILGRATISTGWLPR